MKRNELNVDGKLLALAAEHKSRVGSFSKADRSRRCFIRGQADKLIAKTYPINRDAIWAEWCNLAK